MEPRHSEYLRSLAGELQSQADRVRHLIGDKHWLHEGRHKEHLLGEVLRRHLPATALASTGFVVSPTQAVCSREQDLLVLDCSAEAALFNQGGLVIAFAETVLAAVSVKTTFDSSALRDVADTFMSVRAVAAASGVDPARIWCGAYFFHDTERKDDLLPVEWYREIIESANCWVPYMGSSCPCLPIDVFATSTRHVFIVDSEKTDTSHLAAIRGFVCEKDVSTAVFLSHVIDHMAVRLNKPRSQFMDFADVDEVKMFCAESIPFKTQQEKPSDRQTKT
jgi:hypothetical protein